MPRGKSKTDEEKLAILDSEIAELNTRKDSIAAKIKDLESQKKTILNSKNQENLQKVATLLESQGITAEEAIKKLTGESA